MTAIELYELREKRHNPYNYARVQLILHEMQAFIEKPENRAAVSFRKVVRLNKAELKAMVKYLLVLGFQVTHNLILEDKVTKIHDYELTILFGHEYLDKQINDFLQQISISSEELNCQKILAALNSLESALIRYSGHIGIDEQLSWMYGILRGWSDSSLKEYAERHNIGIGDIARLKNHRNAYLLLKKELEKRAKQ